MVIEQIWWKEILGYDWRNRQSHNDLIREYHYRSPVNFVSSLLLILFFYHSWGPALTRPILYF